MLAAMTLASAETIARRTAMIAQGRCSAVEYQRMVLEKAAAVRDSLTEVVTSGGKIDAEAVLAPWHRRVTANAKRLRKKRR
jgi:hypothetical protein